MLKNFGNRSAIGKASIPQDGHATLLLTWIQRLLSGFVNLGRARGDRRMELMETLQLGGKRQLMLVICDGQRYLVGAGGDSIHTIAEMSRQQPPSVDSPEIGGNPPQTQLNAPTPDMEREMKCIQ